MLFDGHRRDVTQSVGGTNCRPKNWRKITVLSSTECRGYASTTKPRTRHKAGPLAIDAGRVPCDATRKRLRNKSNGRATGNPDLNTSESRLAFERTNAIVQSERSGRLLRRDGLLLSSRIQLAGARPSDARRQFLASPGTCSTSRRPMS